MFLYQEYHFHANLLHIHSWLSTEQCTESTDSNWRMEHYSKILFCPRKKNYSIMFLLCQFSKSLHFLNYFENGALFKNVFTLLISLWELNCTIKKSLPILQILALFQILLRFFWRKLKKEKGSMPSFKDVFALVTLL